MTLKIFRSGTLTEEGERDQLSKIIELLNIYFNDRQKNVYLAVDPKIFDGHPQIDCLFYREGGIVILELKNISGKFEPTFGENNHWQSIESNGEKRPIKKQHKNPFHQVGRQRRALIKFMIENVVRRGDSSENGIAKELGDKIGGWIVTAQNSEPLFKKHPDLFWSKVVPLDKLVNELSHIGTSNREAITEEEFKLLLKKLNCVETNERDVFLTGVVPKYEDGRSPVIESMINSKETEQIHKAIGYCRDLSFIHYFDKFREMIPELSLITRGETYSLLYAWLLNFPQKYSPEDAQSLFLLGIKDDDPDIRAGSLKFFLESSYRYNDKLNEALVHGLNAEKHFNNITLFIEALGSITGKQLASGTLVAFYKNNLKNPFFYWKTNVRQLNRDWEIRDSLPATEELRKKLSEAVEQSSGYGKVLKTWINVSSDMKTKDLLDTILEHLITLLERFPDDSQDESGNLDTLVETIAALGEMRNKDAVDYLIKILIDFKSVRVKLKVIEALGKIGNEKVIREISKFLSENAETDPWDSKQLRNEASMALARLKDHGSFDTIWDKFLHEANDGHEKFYKNNLFDSLLLLDSNRLEERLWNEVEKLNFSKNAFIEYGDFIKGCASNRTVQKCKDLLLSGSDYSSDQFQDPGHILEYVVWDKDNLKKEGENIGFQLLNTGNPNLMAIGISIAESYFMHNPDKLTEYENLESEEIKGTIREMYVRLKRLDKIESFFLNSRNEDPTHLFYCLERIVPNKHFELYTFVKNNVALECEFIIGGAGLYLEVEERVNGTLENRRYIPIPLDRIKYLNKLRINKKTVGALIGYQDNDIVNITLILRSALDWNYLKGYGADRNQGIDELLDVFKKRSNTQEESRVGFDWGQLYKDIKVAYLSEEEIISNKKDLLEESSRFEDEFKPEMITVE